MPRKKTRTKSTWGWTRRNECELQLPSPCEGGRLSQHDVDERRLKEQASSELEFAVLWLQGAEGAKGAVVAQR